MKKIKKTIAALALSAVFLPAFAGDMTSELNIVAQVAATCVMGVPANIPLAYNPKAELVNDIIYDVTCTKGTAFTLNLSAGKSGIENARFLDNGSGEKVNYSVEYVNGSAWGSGANAFSSIGSGNKETFSGVLRIPRSQYVTPGTYVDNLTVTMTY